MINLNLFSPAILPLIIFLLRVADMSLDTIRVISVLRGRKTLVWTLGFIQSAIWVIAITSVLQNLNNLWTLIGYAAGFATGNVVGMLIENRLGIGHSELRVISSHQGHAVASTLRESGFAATEFPGRGKDGAVSIITCTLPRRDVRRAQQVIQLADQEAFITLEEIKPLFRGYWRS